MTRKSKREIERDIEALGGSEEFSLQDYLWADLKAYHGGRLSPGERLLLETPEAHLQPSAIRCLETPGDPQ